MSEEKTSYEKRLEYNNTYNREHYRSFSMRYDVEKEKDIITWLKKQPSVKAYITELIVNDMKAKGE
ncbi:MAG: hypothetical protein IKE36_03315 [Solobacterium sp.]|nr:hypothetical protein [Solobacterium sp.]